MHILKYKVFVFLTLLSLSLFAQDRNDTQSSESEGMRKFEVEKPNIKPGSGSTEAIDEDVKNTTEESNTVKKPKKPKIRPPKIKREKADKFTTEILDELGGVGPDLRTKLLEMGLNRKQVHLLQGQNMEMVSRVVDLIKQRTKNNNDAKADVKALYRQQLRVNRELLPREQYKKVKKMKKTLFKKCENVLEKRLPKK